MNAGPSLWLRHLSPNPVGEPRSSARYPFPTIAARRWSKTDPMVPSAFLSPRIGGEVRREGPLPQRTFVSPRATIMVRHVFPATKEE
jgi:hypothetical protein